MAKPTVRFDDSLPLLAEAVAEELGDQALLAGVVIRDATGRLAFFSNDPLPRSVVERLTAVLRDKLGGYARPDRIVAAPDDYGVAPVLAETSALHIPVGSRRVRLLDRRLVGADWLRTPAAAAPPPPRFVFASIKGGVGRSTALSVIAAHLASRGGRVLVLDLDLEAPGIGAFLLTPETTPEFGMIDALVENGLSGLDDAFLADLVGPSALASQGGRIDVIPAFGRRSIQYPGDVLAKIARAYAEDGLPDGTVATVLDQVRDIVDKFSDPLRYDVILIDSRAGLHETTASAVLGLGAEVLLFGRDEPQTFQGYAALIAHLARFVPNDGPMPEWMERLTVVQAKAPVEAEERTGFDQRWQELFAEFGPGRRTPPTMTEMPSPADNFRDITWNEDISDDDLFAGEWSVAPPIAVLSDDRTVGATIKDSKREGYLPPFPDSVPPNELALYVALERIGVMERRKDGRLDMPDLFRVAAKLLKKGGPAPL